MTSNNPNLDLVNINVHTKNLVKFFQYVILSIFHDCFLFVCNYSDCLNLNAIVSPFSFCHTPFMTINHLKFSTSLDNYLNFILSLPSSVTHLSWSLTYLPMCHVNAFSSPDNYFNFIFSLSLVPSHTFHGH